MKSLNREVYRKNYWAGGRSGSLKMSTQTATDCEVKFPNKNVKNFHPKLLEILKILNLAQSRHFLVR